MMPSAAERWHIDQQQRRLLQEHYLRQQAARLQAQRNSHGRIQQHAHSTAAEGSGVGYTETRLELGDVATVAGTPAHIDIPHSFGDAASLVIEVSYNSAVASPPLPLDEPQVGTLWFWLVGAMSDSDRWSIVTNLAGFSFLNHGKTNFATGLYAAPFLPKLALRLGVKHPTDRENVPFRPGSASAVEVRLGINRF